MKKILLIVATVFLMSTNFILAQVVVIDGDRDAFYDSLTGPDDGYLQLRWYAGNNNGFASGDEDLSAKVWAAWDSTWFYFYTEVMDDIISVNGTASWQNDGIELKVDPEPTDSTVNNIFAPNINVMGGANTDSLSGVPDTSKEWVRKIIPGGYAIEFAIKWEAMTAGGETITPAIDSVFGMAINVHDNDASPAQRVASVMWAAVMLDQVWNTAKYHGTVKFQADNKLQFIPTNNMTGVTNTIPFDGSDYFLPIVIDGMKDPFYGTLTGPDDGYLQTRWFTGNNNGYASGDADLSAKIWTAWDDTWFYLYEEVMDDVVSVNGTASWQNDGLELKIDPQPTDSTVNALFAPNINAQGGPNTDSLSTIPDSLGAKQWARRLIPGGYAIEIAIKWSAITADGETITPAVDSVFGMAINNHDNDASPAQRVATVQWAAVMLDQVWNTTKYHGTVKFQSDNKLQFIPTNNMTGVTNPIPFDGSNYFLPMVIDAQKDPFYGTLTGPDDGYIQLRSFTGNNNGFADDDADLSAKVWSAWDDTWFYFYSEVMDDIVSVNGTANWQSDGLELKIDPQATDSTQNNNSVLSPNLNAMGGPNTDSLTAITDSTGKLWARRIMPGGYALELAIKWSALTINGEIITPDVDSVFGMAVNFHDNDADPPQRVASVMWAAVMLDQVWNTPKYHGRVFFLEDNKLEFDPTNNMTGVFNEIPFNGDDYVDVGDGNESIPLVYSLKHNYPNPFNPTTTITYSIPLTSQVQLTVYDILGRKVVELVNQEQNPGEYKVRFDASSFASGIYFYRIEAGSYTNTQKMMLLK